MNIFERTRFYKQCSIIPFLNEVQRELLASVIQVMCGNKRIIIDSILINMSEIENRSNMQSEDIVHTQVEPVNVFALSGCGQ